MMMLLSRSTASKTTHHVCSRYCVHQQSMRGATTRRRMMMMMVAADRKPPDHRLLWSNNNHAHSSSWYATTPPRRLRHTLALCRDLPDSFQNAVSIPRTDGGDSSVPVKISLDLAHQQHQNYVACLRQYLPTLCLPALESHPDCVFVEDTVVVVGRQAVVTLPGHISRRGEVESIRVLLEQLGIEIVADLSKNLTSSSTSVARLDGGDVLYTGRHLFVGLSTRTNSAACEILQTAFPDVEVVAVALPPPTDPTVPTTTPVLHLKSAVTHLDAHTLLIPEGSWGDALLQALQAKARGYAVVRLPDVLACNAVVLSDQHLVAQDTQCTISRQQLMDAAFERNLTIDFVDTSELAKKDAALTCCSVLLEL